MGPEPTTPSPSGDATAAHARMALLAAIGVVVLVALFPLLDTGYVVPDDFGYSIWAHQDGRWQEAWKSAEVTGRFNMFFHIALNLVPHAVEGQVWLKSIQIGSLVAALLLFGHAVARLTGHQAYGWLTTLLFAAFLPNMWEHHLYAAYPFVFQLGCCAFMLALLAFARGLEDPSPRHRVLAGALLFVALLTYEAFLPLVAVFVVIVAARRPSLRGRAAAAALAPPGAAVLAFLALYVGWRLAFPSQYDGGQIATAASDPLRALRVVWQFATASLPGYVLMHFSELHQRFAGSPAGFERTAGSLLANLRVEWVVKALAVGIGVWLAQHIRRPGIGRLRIGGPLTVAALVFLLPSVPLALTPKYQQWVASGAQAYVVTYFSYFGVVLALAALPAALADRSGNERRRRRALAAVAAGCAVISLATDFGNAAMHRSQRLYAERWPLFTALVSSADFEEVEAGSCVLLDGLTTPLAFGSCNPTYWQLAAEQATGRPFAFFDRRDELAACAASGRSAYVVRFRQEENGANQFILLARVTAVGGDGPVGDRAVILSSGYARRLTLLASAAAAQPLPPPALRIDGIEVAARPGRSTYEVDKAGARGAVLRTEIAMQRLVLDSVALIPRFE